MKRNALLPLGTLALLLGSSSLWADGTVSGVVRDAQNGLSLEGVKVSVPGVAATTTDRSGRFRFDLPSGSHTLHFDYLGSNPVTEDVQIRDGETTSVEETITLEIYELDQFVVQGTVIGSARALNQQRASENLRNIVASDAIGKFPDENAAEALARLPGVSVERDQGEGRFIVIRGINPELNSVSIDGIAVPTPGASERETLLDTIPTETLSSMEVTKAVLPDQPGDSIGGHINLVSPSAFDRDERFASLYAAGLYSNLTEEWGYKTSAFYSDLLGEDQHWGLALSAVWSERKFGSDNMEADPWELMEGEDGAEHWVQTDTIELREYNLKRERRGFSFNLEYRPTDTAQYYVRGNFSDYTDTEIRHAGVLSFGEEWEDENEDEGDITSYREIGDNAFTAENVALGRELKDREETMSIYAVSLGGQNIWDNLTLDYKLGVSYAKEDTPYDFETKFELIEDANHTDPTDGDYQAYLVNPDFRFTGTQNDTMRLAFVGPDSDIDPYDAGSYEFDEIEDADQLVEETNHTAELNLRYDFDNTYESYVKTGGLVRRKDKENDVSVRKSDDNPEAIDTLAGFVNGDVRDPYDSNLPYVRENLRDYFRANQDAFAMEEDLEDSYVEDYDANETVSAAYLMGGATFDRLLVIAGARVEHTEFETAGYLYDDEAERVSPNEFDNDYTNFMPGIHLRYAINDNFIARASWTNTISRPNFEQLSPGIVDEDGDQERGNPMLDPYEAMNWDASLEYYFENVGVVSIAAFYKDVDSFIYTQEIQDGVVDNDGNVLGDLTTFRNGDSGDIMGVELAYQQQLTFLPVEGFNLLANLTLTDSEASVLGESADDAGRDLPFVKQSDVIGNLALSYDYNNFFVRLSGTYRDDYLDEVGGSPSEDRYVDSHIQVDLSTSYTFAHNWTVFADLINITNEPFKAYWGQSGRLSQFEEYGWSAVVGLKWSL